MDRKEYNKLYYSKNKDRVLSMLKKKVTCELCNRSVSHQNLKKHMQTEYCKSRQLQFNATHVKDIKDSIQTLIDNMKQQHEKELQELKDKLQKPE